MFVVDSLVVMGISIVSLGSIHEADGVKEHTFWLRNAGTEAVALTQGYTSCGCTTIHFNKDILVSPGDSTAVILRFNPQGKGGEFVETGTIVYGPSHKRMQMSMIGNCITSEETLLRQFPIRIDDHLRLSTNRFDLGIMYAGEKKERSVVVLHKDESYRQERISISFTPDASTPKGVQHIPHPIIVNSQGQELTLTITFDVLIK